ncbi:hypothetical protein GCM10010531_05500 [Blastococcus jejuensis]|uniref:Uncharacterized protein n=1 Tax=Blastococcus jejuensis TaxID=351224 RepID=A0ABP6NSI5_9ACTN
MEELAIEPRAWTTHWPPSPPNSTNWPRTRIAASGLLLSTVGDQPAGRATAGPARRRRPGRNYRSRHQPHPTVYHVGVQSPVAAYAAGKAIVGKASVRAAITTVTTA